MTLSRSSARAAGSVVLLYASLFGPASHAQEPTGQQAAQIAVVNDAGDVVLGWFGELSRRAAGR